MLEMHTLLYIIYHIDWRGGRSQRSCYYQDSPELKLAYVLKSVVDSYSSLRLVSYFEEFTMTTVTQAVILMHLEQVHILFYV